MTNPVSRPSPADRTPLRLVAARESPSTAEHIRQAIESNAIGAHGLQDLVDRCGSVEALATITDLGPTDGGVTASDLHQTAAAPLSALLDEALSRCDEEYRSIVRSLSLIASNHSDKPLQRRTSPQRLAAALTWIALMGNGRVGRSNRWQAADIWFWFDVGNCAPLARAIAADLGMLADPLRSASSPRSTDIVLGDPALLHSNTRQLIATRRDLCLQLVAEDGARRRAARPVKPVGNGQISISARPLCVLTAFRVDNDGRDLIVSTFGETAADPDEAIALSIPDARLLHQRLGEALDGPRRL